MITKTSDGKILRLENGNESAGLKHIIDRYSDSLAAQGVKDIPVFLKMILQTNPMNTAIEADILFADFMINGTCYRVVYRSSGYIESFHRVE